MKRICLVLVIVSLSILIGIQSGMAENAGNKVCPVGGEQVDGVTTYEYKGKTYNFCCPACIGEFKKHPERYIEKVEKELKAGAAPSHEAHEGHHH